MAKIRPRPESGHLYFDFTFRGHRCREQTTLADTAENRKRMEQVLDKIQAEITLGTLDYAKYFPSSPLAKRFACLPTHPAAANGGTPTLATFAETWLQESEVRWRQSTRTTNRLLIETYVLPRFGETPMNQITRADILKFRSDLARPEGRKKPRSAKTLNHVMAALRMVLAEAALRYDLKDPSVGIKRLRVQRQEIQPFSLDEVSKILETVRADFRPYFTVRFFTGMRTGEMHGLKWKHIDFARRQILVRETFMQGRTEYTKTDGSQREIHMSQPVFDALKAQEAATKRLGEYVFCSRTGQPLDANNVANRVWYPLLRHLDLPRRRPYQCRHTCATFWLGAGENPAWIAQQLGHTTPEMLFRVYARFVPNLTRQDGSAMERLLRAVTAGQAATQEEGAANG